MLDEDTRRAVLRLRREGHGTRAIAKALKIARDSVRSVLQAGTAEVPEVRRDSRLDVVRERIVALHEECRGNFVRVHEKLGDEGVAVGYATLTDYCRQHGIGHTPKKLVGEYHFEPGEEMQHDTSPHSVRLGERELTMQCASLVLCHSRMLYAQAYFSWSRLQARIFLTEAIEWFGGAAGRCMVDNSSVVLAHGTGRNAVAAAEMVALGERFGFAFAAHEVGDANRSARVERPFHFIENNFYPGRVFADRDDCNRQLRAWCEKVNAKHRKDLHASAVDLLAAERAFLKPLPLHVPEVYEPHSRLVDQGGFVTLHTNRYSAPEKLIDRQVEVRECKDKVRIWLGPRQVAEHPLLAPGRHGRSKLPEHHVVQRRLARQQPTAEEGRLRAADATLGAFVDGLRKRHPGRAVMAMRRLERIWHDHPQGPVLEALSEALNYGMYDLGRLEKMVLRRIAGEVFGLDGPQAYQLDLDLEMPADDP